MVDLTDSSEAAVIGALYWVWSTADQHTEDGTLPGLSLKQIDRKTGVPGIGAALVEVGWLVDNSDGVQLVRFGEHNGASAKTRCETARRVAKCRSTKDVTQTPLHEPYTSVTGALAREREREDISPSLRSGDRARAPARPESVSEQVWADWLALRKAKKAPVTQTVLDQAHRQAELANIPLQAFLEIWCARGSQGLMAEWLKTDEKARYSPVEPRKEEVDTRAYLDRQKALEAELSTPEAREKARQAAAMLKTMIKRVV